VLLRRGKTYYARVRVAKDMIDTFGRAELKKSLKTDDRREAKAAASELEHKAQTAFLRLRTGMLTEKEKERVAAELIAEFTGRMGEHKKERQPALDWLLSDNGSFPLVDTDTIELSLKTPKTSADVAGLVQWYSVGIEQLEGELATEFYSRETRLNTRRVAEAKGISVAMPPVEWFSEPGRVAPSFSSLADGAEEEQQDQPEPPTPEEIQAWESPAPPEFSDLCRTVVQAQIDAYQHELERAKGKLNTPLQQQVAARVEKAKKPRLRLSDLWEVYRDSSKENWTAGSLERNNGVFAQIVDILGDVELSELEDERQAIKLRDSLKIYPSSKEKKKAFSGKPFSPEMSKHADFKPLGLSGQIKAVDLTSSIMKFALRNPKKWGISCNVFAGSQPKDTRSDSSLRNEYQQADILKLIEALKTTRPKWEPERLWIPLLSLFTGARQNELCQLRTADIGEVDGIWYIDICHKPELDQRTKKEKSRTCPIHPALIDLGFLDYVAAQTHERLWPNLKLRNEKWQHEFSKWYCHTFSKKFCDPAVRKLDFHGLRHTFINWFKQNGALNFDTAKLLKSLVGHLDNFDSAVLGAVADDMTFDRYGKDYAIKKQYELICQLDYGVDLSGLKAVLAG
jgi:integrase